jgi:hypothetical protein
MKQLRPFLFAFLVAGWTGPVSLSGQVLVGPPAPADPALTYPEPANPVPASAGAPEETFPEDNFGAVVLKPVTIRPWAYANMDAETARQYRRTRYHVIKVYPYALDALAHMAALDSVVQQADRRREGKRYRNELEKTLKDDFKDDLKNLSRTQGKILISMLERQTGRPFYDLLRDLKNGVSATFWQTLGKTYGYDLKDGYDPSEDPMLELILSEMEWPDYRPQGEIMR